MGSAVAIGILVLHRRPPPRSMLADRSPRSKGIVVLSKTPDQRGRGLLHFSGWRLGGRRLGLRFDNAPSRAAEVRKPAALLPLGLIVHQYRSARVVLNGHGEPAVGAGECSRLGHGRTRVKMRRAARERRPLMPGRMVLAGSTHEMGSAHALSGTRLLNRERACWIISRRRCPQLAELGDAVGPSR